MAKRNNNYEKSPLKMVIYILAVLFLLGCIGYLLVCSRREKVAYREELEKVSALEADTETSEEKETEKQQEAPSTDEQKAAVTKTSEVSEAAEDFEADAKTDSATEKEKQTSVTPKLTITPTVTVTTGVTVTPGLTAAPTPAAENTDEGIAEVDKNVGVLVLNGTKRPGVAAYWKTKLETAGYENVVPATYNKTVGQETVIYAPNVEAAKPFLELFPNATVQVGMIADGIELQAGVVMPENCEVYIVIGNSDVNR